MTLTLQHTLMAQGKKVVWLFFFFYIVHVLYNSNVCTLSVEQFVFWKWSKLFLLIVKIVMFTCLFIFLEIHLSLFLPQSRKCLYQACPGCSNAACRSIFCASSWLPYWWISWNPLRYLRSAPNIWWGRGRCLDFDAGMCMYWYLIHIL